MLGAIAASILGLKKWAPNYDRLVTETEWQGGSLNSWIPLRKPITYVYEDYSIGNEIFLFIMAIAIAFWAWRNRHHKVDGTSARIFLVAAVGGAAYLSLTWLARHHVEGDWTAAPPRLMRYEVDTPEEIARNQAFAADMEAYMIKIGYPNAEARQKHSSTMFGKFMSFIALVVLGVMFTDAA